MIKFFLWKACRNVLATKENLHRRNIVADPLCSICGLETENVGHILWRCGFTQDGWLESSRKIQKSSSGEEEFINIFAEMVDKLEPTEVQAFAVIARLIWLQQNFVIFRGSFSTPAEILRQSKE